MVGLVALALSHCHVTYQLAQGIEVNAPTYVSMLIRHLCGNGRDSSMGRSMFSCVMSVVAGLIFSI